MKKLISFKQAVKWSILAFSFMTIFHLLVVIDILFLNIVPIEFLWGGHMETSTELLKFEFISILITIICILIVLIRTKKIKKTNTISIVVSRVGLWLMTLLFLLNILGNLIAKTTFEKLFSVITIVLAFLCFRMAIEPLNEKTSNLKKG